MKYSAKEGKFRDLTRDVGAGGIFISTKRKIKKGRRINVQFPIFAFEMHLSLMGTVVRCEPEGFAVRFEEAIDVGIFKDGRFPGNIKENKRSTTRIDKHGIDSHEPGGKAETPQRGTTEVL
jgi:Tfp pilus assembly protein PilZ